MLAVQNEVKDQCRSLVGPAIPLFKLPANSIDDELQYTTVRYSDHLPVVAWSTPLHLVFPAFATPHLFVCVSPVDQAVALAEHFWQSMRVPDERWTLLRLTALASLWNAL